MDQFGDPSRLEHDGLQALNAGEFEKFERRVVQVKAIYKNNAKMVSSDSTYLVIAQYLLFLLASDRIELESISSHEQNHHLIKYPIQLERYIMEGNYAKVLSEKRDKVFDVLFQKLHVAVQAKQQQTRLESGGSGLQASGISLIDPAAALTVLSNMHTSEIREEISKLRRQLSHMSVEWDLMWDLSKLREEVGDAVKKFPQGKKILSPEIRYHVIHLRVNRITCYLRNLLVGLFKIRITIASPVPSCRLHPTILEGFPFSPSTCEDNFRLAIPLNSLGPQDQLSFWRIEIEILHKYPAAPLYSIVARSWVSPETLSQASALDLFSTVETPSESSIPCVRMDLLSVVTSAAPVNLFRVAGRSVLCTVRLAHALARRKKTEAQQLEREIQFLITRDRNDRQDMQIDLLMRTVQVMNKYMEKGSNPEQWVSAIMKANERPDNKRLEELSSSVEALRNDVMKALLVERPPPIVQIVHPPVLQKEIEPLSSAELTDLKIEASSVRGALSVKDLKDARSVIAAKGARGVMEANFQDDEKRRQPEAPGVHELENRRSVDSAEQNPQPVKETRSVISSQQPPHPVEETTEGEGLIDEEGSTTPKNEIIEQVEEAEDVGTTVMSALWGAFAGGQEPKVKTPSKMNTAPLIKAVSGKNPVPTTSPTKAVSGKTPVPTTSPTSKKTTTMIPPPKKSNLVPKTKPPTTPVNPKTQELQQKLAVIAKIKQLEAKRKAEVDSTAAAIAQLAKKLPPIDSKKFIGLPGPPPFIPKAKVKAASNEENGIPSAIAPPEIEEDEAPQGVDVIN